MAGRLLKAMLKSAWPGPSIDNLLRAVALKDRTEAASSWRAFEAEADFDDLTMGEFRLVSLAAKRLAELAPDSPMRPRISGIERSIWTRSQLAIGEAATGLRKLAEASVDMLMIKGAGRAASGELAARGRFVNDIDVVVRPEDIEQAFDILIADGWTPAGSGSVLYHRSRLADQIGTNLVRGEFGNIDLHRTPFTAPFDRMSEDTAIWQRSLPGRLGYTAVRVPHPVDTIVIAIAHGSLDAHKSSDWLADIAVSIDKGVDWSLFLAIAERRRLQAAAAVALGYVRKRLERPIPAEVMARLEKAAGADPVRLLATVAEIRPKSQKFGVFWLARAVAKQNRLFRVEGKAKSRSKVVLASPFARSGSLPACGEFTFEQELDLPARQVGTGWSGAVDIEMVAKLPSAARRVEFEINSRERHLLRLRAIVRDRGRRQLPLRFRTRLAILPEDSALFLQAVPARTFNANVPPEKRDRYDATPFRLLRLDARRSG